MSGDIDIGDETGTSAQLRPRGPALPVTSPELIVEEAERLLATMRALEEAVKRLKKVHETLREVEPCVERIGEALARLHDTAEQ